MEGVVNEAVDSELNDPDQDRRGNLYSQRALLYLLAPVEHAHPSTA
jgi:hypothetical protein